MRTEREHLCVVAMDVHNTHTHAHTHTQTHTQTHTNAHTQTHTHTLTHMQIHAQGVYVLQDNSFRWIQRFASAPLDPALTAEMHKLALDHLHLPCGIIRGWCACTDVCLRALLVHVKYLLVCVCVCLYVACTKVRTSYGKLCKSDACKEQGRERESHPSQCLDLAIPTQPSVTPCRIRTRHTRIVGAEKDKFWAHSTQALSTIVQRSPAQPGIKTYTQ